MRRHTPFILPECRPFSKICVRLYARCPTPRESLPIKLTLLRRGSARQATCETFQANETIASREEDPREEGDLIPQHVHAYFQAVMPVRKRKRVGPLETVDPILARTHGIAAHRQNKLPILKDVGFGVRAVGRAGLVAVYVAETRDVDP